MFLPEPYSDTSTCSSRYHAINRAPIDERQSEAIYEIHVVTGPETVGEVRDLLAEVLEKASHPIRQIEVFRAVARGYRDRGHTCQHRGPSGAAGCCRIRKCSSLALLRRVVLTSPRGPDPFNSRACAGKRRRHFRPLHDPIDLCHLCARPSTAAIFPRKRTTGGFYQAQTNA
jgi:hypothetical protein